MEKDESENDVTDLKCRPQRNSKSQKHTDKHWNTSDVSEWELAKMKEDIMANVQHIIDTHNIAYTKT